MPLSFFTIHTYMRMSTTHHHSPFLSRVFFCALDKRSRFFPLYHLLHMSKQKKEEEKERPTSSSKA